VTIESISAKIERTLFIIEIIPETIEGISESDEERLRFLEKSSAQKEGFRQARKAIRRVGKTTP